MSRWSRHQGLVQIKAAPALCCCWNTVGLGGAAVGGLTVVLVCVTLTVPETASEPSTACPLLPAKEKRPWPLAAVEVQPVTQLVPRFCTALLIGTLFRLIS